MNDRNAENDGIERLLAKAHPAEPSAELRERVTLLARKAWHESPAIIPWWNGVRWPAASAAAAVLIVSFANYLSDRTLAAWQSKRTVAISVQNRPVDEFLEVSYGPVLRHMIAARTSAGRNAFTLFAYMERIRDALAETEQSGDSGILLAPMEGRSRLVPARSGFYYCS